mmetsp:Transcript_1461/g.3264  ORF Transcript_1461/g.3264 Transcript_1461/m.3264 type:complete len:261 (+) Transcript_1461:2-784(+)
MGQVLFCFAQRHRGAAGSCVLEVTQVVCVVRRARAGLRVPRAVHLHGPRVLRRHIAAVDADEREQHQRCAQQVLPSYCRLLSPGRDEVGEEGERDGERHPEVDCEGRGEDDSLRPEQVREHGADEAIEGEEAEDAERSGFEALPASEVEEGEEGDAEHAVDEPEEAEEHRHVDEGLVRNEALEEHRVAPKEDGTCECQQVSDHARVVMRGAIVFSHERNAAERKQHTRELEQRRGFFEEEDGKYEGEERRSGADDGVGCN